MDEIIYIQIYNFTNEDGSITRRMFDMDEPSIEYINVECLDGMIEIFTN